MNEERGRFRASTPIPTSSCPYICRTATRLKPSGAWHQKPRVWLTPLHIAEWTHAVAQHVFRKEISGREAGVVDAELELDREAGLWLEIDLPESVWEGCAHLARQHGPKLGTRTPGQPARRCGAQTRSQVLLDLRRPSGASTTGKPHSQWPRASQLPDGVWWRLLLGLDSRRLKLVPMLPSDQLG